MALYDRVEHRWGEPECSILIDDYYDSGFTVLYGGHAPDGVSVDVYFPDSNLPASMDRVVNDATESGTPVRIERMYGDEFPLGLYAFDVHIDYETYHFMWARTKNSMNTFSLSCLDRELLTVTGRPDAYDIEAETITRWKMGCLISGASSSAVFWSAPILRANLI